MGEGDLYFKWPEFTENHIGARIRVHCRSTACLSPSYFTNEKTKALKGKGLVQSCSNGPGILTPHIRLLSPVTCYFCHRVLALCSLGWIRDLKALSGLVGENKLTERLGAQEYYVTF